MNAKTSVFAVCIEAILYLLLNNFHAFTFNTNKSFHKAIPLTKPRISFCKLK